MDPQASMLPLLAVSLPALTALAVLAARRAPKLRDALLSVGSIITFVCVAAMLPAVLNGQPPTATLIEVLPGIELTLRADGMGMVFALLASLLWVLASPYAIGYLRGDGAKNQTRFMTFYALCLSTAFGVAFAADLITFFVFYELLTVATYPLVTHKGNDEAVAAGRKYLGYLISGGAAVLLATAIVYTQTGEVAFAAGGFVGSGMSNTLIVVSFLLFAVGFGTKAGLMPLHAWLPAAMVAPTPVSALLHAVAVVKAGVFAFGRLIGFVFGPDVLAEVGIATLLAIVSGATIVVASIFALRQDHLKRRLAYSTIAHLAYIVLGFALLSQSSYEGSLLHIINHGALKITLFFVAGALHVHLHLDHVSELDGVGRKMPYAMGAFALASLGLAGLPPMGGFLSKWYLVLGAYEAGEYLFASIMVFSGLFTAGYLFPVVYRAFFRPLPDSGEVAPTGVDPGAAALDATTAEGTGATAAPAGTRTDVRTVRISSGGAADRPSGLSGLANLHASKADVAATPEPRRSRWRDASPLMVVPLVITALLGLVLGLGDLLGVYELADLVADAVFGASR